MKMIWGIFKRDMCHATRNVIAVIVSMGLVVVPALYAWFNIAASWDLQHQGIEGRRGQ